MFGHCVRNTCALKMLTRGSGRRRIRQGRRNVEEEEQKAKAEEEGGGSYERVALFN